ncbi:polysaccharide deacetylase family protein [Patescibacteria group bacterium]|nr:polysaccharide deacetylase family protein [Patescibacteria group bacterium]MBU4458392.1 polysaccharide deacetylase family protein [Patescibacteria group bacterium]MCG2695853.1 polysaccharide deacetylase family protein [Candidatus Portnoybacteria bacterium]
MRTCFLSIDVESSYARTKVGASKDKNPFESVDKLDCILDIFRKHNVPATLFVTGEVLEYCPDLVKKWSKDFEIGCHNYWHVQLDKIDLVERERQVKNFVNLYKGIFGFSPKGFRAPRNVIDNQQFPILERYDFIYDASVFPRYPWRIGAYVGYRGRAPIAPYWPSRKNYREKGDIKILEIPESPALFDVPFVGTWLRKLGVKFFKFIFKIKKPEFISFSMHSWDGIEFENGKNSGKKYLKQLDEMLGFLKKIGYNFKSGEQISSEIA